MKLRYDLIALDVDGTLLTDDHKLLDDVKEAVNEAAAEGAEIVLCTGRGPLGALPILDQLGLGGTLITHNGAATVQSADREVLFQFNMNPDHLREYIVYCRKQGVHFDINTPFDIMIESATGEVEAMYNHHGVTPEWFDFDQRLPDSLVKMTLFGSKERIDRVESDWMQWSTRLQVIRSGDYFIDVQHANASKGKALRQLAGLRGIDQSRILAIGNYYNDISMLQYAGLGIAMGNAPDEVKRAADAIAASNSECGAATALRQYAWS